MTCNKERTSTARANKKKLLCESPLFIHHNSCYVQLILMYVVLFRNHFPRESLVWGGGEGGRGGSLDLTDSRKMAKKISRWA